MTEQIPFTPQLTFNTLSNESLEQYFLQSWETYEMVFSSLISDKAFYQRAHPLRHPLIFYYGHTAAFYVQKMKLAGLLSEDVSDLDAPMERGVSPEDPDDLAGNNGWPSIDRVRNYRKQVYDIVLNAIRSVDTKVTAPQSPVWALLMGIEHENIHLHTTLPLLRQLPDAYKSTPTDWPQAYTTSNDQSQKRVLNTAFIRCEGGLITMGVDPDNVDCFRWDNELGIQQCHVPPFSVAPFPATNADFLAFVLDGGYDRNELWTTDQSDLFLEKLTRKHPNSWVADGEGGFKYRHIFETQEMPWNAPVEVCRHEAVAFANWSGARLISEPQYHALLQQEHGGRIGIANRLGDFNIGLRFGGPAPVQSLRSALGKNGTDFIGNVALWVNDDFAPLNDGAFRVDPLYDDFSEPWFGPQTGMVLGASYAARGHMTDIGNMRDFMQNHMDQPAGILLTREA